MPCEPDRRSVLLGAAALAATWAAPASANPACKLFDNTIMWDVEHALWTSTGKTPSGKVIYVVGAPWCPYCQRIYRSHRENPIDVELRFLPMDVPQQADQRKLVDILIHQDGSGLERTYLTGEPPKIDVDAATYRLVLDAARHAAYGLRERLRPHFGKWGSPVLLHLEAGGGFAPYIGFVDPAEIAGYVRPDADTVEPVYPSLSSMMDERPIARKVVHVGAEGALMLSLPHDDMAAAGCLAQDFALTAVAEVSGGGKEWYKVEGIVFDGDVAHAYVDRASVTG